MLAKFFIGFKDPLGFYKTKKDGYTTLEKAKESEKKQIKYKWNSDWYRQIRRAKSCNEKY